MKFVKAEFPLEQTHVPMLMGLLFQEIHATFAAEDWNDLRQSHFRVISAVPDQGVSITELGDRVRMTKQGCGQFVSHLVETGHLATEPDPSDRRIRVVRRTQLGQNVLDAVQDRNLRIEREWAGRVGMDRYQVFRSVLQELALGRTSGLSRLGLGAGSGRLGDHEPIQNKRSTQRAGALRGRGRGVRRGRR